MIKKLIILSVVAVSLASCDMFKKDNYQPPNAQLHGRILDEVTGELVETDIYEGSVFRWQELGRPGQSVDDLMVAIDQMAHYPVPASMLESLILPARLSGYQPHLLDQLMLAGEVAWSGHGAIGESDGWVSLWPADVAGMVEPKPLDNMTEAARQIWEQLAGGGAWSLDSLTSTDLTPAQMEAAIWELVWAGRVTSDTLAPVRSLGRAGGALRRPHVPRTRRVVRPMVSARLVSPGRWFALPSPAEADPARLIQAISLELNRYGILTKGSVLTEAMTPSFFEAYRVLAAMEDQGATRRGYFIDGLGAAQFALPGAVDRLRDTTKSGMVLLAACDPANPWGAGLAWPESKGHRPTRKAGAMVVLDNGAPVIYLERGAHTLVTFDDHPEPVVAALKMVGEWVDRRHLDTITLTKINSETALEARQWAEPLQAGGFTMTPQGFRRRAAT